MAGLVAVAPKLIFGAVWLGLILYLRLSKRRSFGTIVLTALFGVYLYAVLDLAILQYQSLLVLKLFNPDLILRGFEGEASFNLVPIVALSGDDLRTSLLNVLMTVPFGLALPFLTRLRFWGVLGVGLLFSLAIELIQFVTGALAGTTFRVADINDVLFNTAGAALGYALFAGVARLFPRFIPSLNGEAV